MSMWMNGNIEKKETIVFPEREELLKLTSLLCILRIRELLLWWLGANC